MLLIFPFAVLEDGIGTHSKFFIAFMDCFEAQLAQVPSDFFVDVLSGVNFLTPLLKVRAKVTCSIVATCTTDSPLSPPPRAGLLRTST
jgi:hypothetical protein